MKTTRRALWLLGGNTIYDYFAWAKLCLWCAWTVFPLCLNCVSIVLELCFHCAWDVFQLCLSCKAWWANSSWTIWGRGENWGSGVEVEEGYNTRFLPFRDRLARFCSCKKNYLDILSYTGFPDMCVYVLIEDRWLGNLTSQYLLGHKYTNTQIHIKTHTNTDTQITHLSISAGSRLWKEMRSGRNL